MSDGHTDFADSQDTVDASADFFLSRYTIDSKVTHSVLARNISAFQSSSEA